MILVEATLTEWDKKLKSVYNTDEFYPTLKQYLEEVLPGTVNAEDSSIVGIFQKWYDAFHTVNNPLYNYALTVHTKDNTRELSYTDLIVFNNAYAKKQITDKDIKLNQPKDTLMELLLNPSYYEGDAQSKEYWIEIFQFLSKQKNIDTIFQGVNDQTGITLGKSHPVSYWKKLYNLRNRILFDSIDTTGNLRSAIDIEKYLNYLASIEGRTGEFEKQQETRRDANKTLKDKESIEKWIKDNKINANTLAILKDFLNSVDVNAI